jgi:hypothetical protein
MIRSIVSGALCVSVGLVALSLARPAEAMHHEKVLQVVTVDVKPGMLEQYRKQVSKLAGVFESVGSKARVQMWDTTQGGEDTGQILVGIEFPNAAAWAEDTGKAQGTSEWQKIMEGLPAMRTVVSSAMWKEITQNPVQSAAIGSGGALVVTAVGVMPGQLDEYRKRVGNLRGIVERLKITSSLRMWQATLAGAQTGSVVVAVEYKDLSSYVADQAKLESDPEWEKILSGLDAIRSFNGRSLYQNITP